MTRHFVNLKVQSEKITRRRFFDQEIGLTGSTSSAKPKSRKKFDFEIIGAVSG